MAARSEREGLQQLGVGERRETRIESALIPRWFDGIIVGALRAPVSGGAVAGTLVVELPGFLLSVEGQQEVGFDEPGAWCELRTGRTPKEIQKLLCPWLGQRDGRVLATGQAEER